MTDLTEQWKKGELPSGWYYIEVKALLPFSESSIIEPAKYITSFNYPTKEIKKVLAPVPSCEEWQAKLEENEKLKELLKECREILYAEEMIASNPKYIDKLRLLIKRSNQVLGEDK